MTTVSRDGWADAAPVFHGLLLVQVRKTLPIIDTEITPLFSARSKICVLPTRYFINTRALRTAYLRITIAARPLIMRPISCTCASTARRRGERF